MTILIVILLALSGIALIFSTISFFLWKKEKTFNIEFEDVQTDVKSLHLLMEYGEPTEIYIKKSNDDTVKVVF